MNHEILAVATVALKHCPSSKLVLEKSLRASKPMISSGNQIFANPELYLERKNAQHHWEPGTPNINPISFVWTRLVSKTFLS